MHIRKLSAGMVIFLFIGTAVQLTGEGGGGQLPCPTKWHKAPQNPVLVAGAPGQWDDIGVSPHSVLWDGARFLLYYQGTNESVSSIGLATSPDGIKWERFSNNPVLPAGNPGSWDEMGAGTPWVIKDASGYRMWFSGYDGTAWRIGYATSSDGLAWNEYAGNPVLDTGSPGSWDSDEAISPTVLADGGSYKMWYGGGNGTSRKIGHATSPDGLSWSRYAANPVFGAGAAESWENASVSGPCVLNVSGKYELWYSGTNGHGWAIGYAYSADGISWTRHSGNPVLEHQGGGWESRHNLQPAVYHNGTAYTMWYCGASDSASTAIGLAAGWNSAPNVPVLLGPEGDAWVNRSGLTFSWVFSDSDPGDRQGGFELQLDDDPAFESIDYDSGAISSPSQSFTIPSPVMDGSWYWRLGTVDESLGPSGWSAASRFFLDSALPDNPVSLSSPSHCLGVWSTDPTVQVCWSLPAGGDAGSGYEGFAAVWDQKSDSVPGPVVALPAGAVSMTSPPLGDGANYLHLRARDRAGNWAADVASLGPFLIDMNPPSGPSNLTSPSHTISSWSNDDTVDLSWSAAIDPISGLEGYSILWDESNATIPPAEVSVGASLSSCTSPALRDGDRWYAHIRAEDRAGNWGTGATHLGPFRIDTSPPKIAYFGLQTGAKGASTISLDLSVSAHDPSPGSGLLDMRFSLDGIGWTDWEQYSTTKRLLARDVDGANGIHLEVRDKLQNTNRTGPVDIYVDRVAPSGTSLNINNGSEYTNSTGVSLSIEASDASPSSGLMDMAISADGTVWGPWQPYRSRLDYSIGSSNGRRDVFVQVRDSASNEGPVARAEIFLDTSAPRLNAAILANGRPTWGNLTVPVQLQTADPEPSSGCAEASFSEDNVSWSPWLPYDGKIDYTFTAGEGKRALYCRARDRAGNPSGPLAASITIDTTPPMLYGISASAASSRTAAILWRANEPSDGKVEYGLASAFGSVQLDTGFVRDHGVVLEGLLPDSQYNFRISGRDLSGNTAPAVKEYYFKTPKADNKRPPVLFNVRVEGVSKTSALICWETDEPADGQVDCGPTKALGTPLNAPTMCCEHRLMISGLAPGTRYHFQAQSRDAAGNGPSKGKLMAFSTMDQGEPARQWSIQVQFTSIGRTTAVISWRTDELTTGVLDFGSGAQYDRQIKQEDMSFVHTAVIGGLLPATGYHFRIGATDINGIGPGYTRDMAFNTASSGDSGTPKIGEIRIQAIGRDRIILNVPFDEPATALVEYGETESYGSSLVSPDFQFSRTMIIFGLSPGRTYHFRVSAYDVSGNGPASSRDFKFRTAAASATTAEVGPGLLVPLLLILVVAVLSIVVAGRRMAASRKARIAVQPALAEEELPVPPEPEPGTRPAAPTAGRTETGRPPKKYAVVRKVDVKELTRTIPPEAPPPGDADAKGAPSERRFPEELIRRAIASLPRGIPTALYTSDIDRLASMLAGAEYKRDRAGKLVVRIGSEWYYGDPADPASYLQHCEES